MNFEEFSKAKQDLSNVLDTLFTKVISGTSIQNRDVDRFNDSCGTLVKVIGKLSEDVASHVALTKCKALTEAISKAFGAMEEHNSNQIKALEERIKVLENTP